MKLIKMVTLSATRISEIIKSKNYLRSEDIAIQKQIFSQFL